MPCQPQIKFYREQIDEVIPACGEVKPMGGSTMRVQPVNRYESIGCGMVGAVTTDSSDGDRGTALGSSPDRYVVIARNLDLTEPLKQLKDGRVFADIEAGGSWDEVSGQVERVRRYGNVIEILIDPAKVMSA
jgi:hypothetical protein